MNSLDSDKLWDNTLADYQRQREKELEQAYQLGLLHGINASSMARIEQEIMEFEDYGWQL